MSNDIPRNDLPHVSLHEHEIQSMMEKYPKLTRSEIVHLIGRVGPLRSDVEAALEALSAKKS